MLRFFRFSSSDRPAGESRRSEVRRHASRLGPALERARDELAGLPLAGLVMVTDGADTSDATLDEPLASLKARSIPVFPVGVGQERFARDIQISRVETPRSTLKGTSLAVDVVDHQTGYGGATVPAPRRRRRPHRQLAAGHAARRRRVGDRARHLHGHRRRRAAVPVPGAAAARRAGHAEQHARRARRGRDRREKVLYIEGEPRFEVKFIRRAVDDDKNLQVVILQRTAEDKYLRLDVGSPDELVGGFPKTREELFAYRAIILGSVEAASFSPDQLRMLADFVSKRGGGLLMLGGRRSFAEGGWAGTPVAEVLPVELDTTDARRSRRAVLPHLAVHPTRAGATYPGDAARRHREGVHGEVERDAGGQRGQSGPRGQAGRDGPADRRPTNSRQDQVVLAYQRYGRGKALAFRSRIRGSGRWTRRSR